MWERPMLHLGGGGENKKEGGVKRKEMINRSGHRSSLASGNRDLPPPQRC